MGKWSAARVLTPPIEQELRRLRFTDPDLEAAFKFTYAEKSRVHLRGVLGLTLIIPILEFVSEVLQGTPRRFAWLVLTIHSGALLLTWSPWFARLFQICLAFLCFIAGSTLLVSILPAPDSVVPLVVASLYTYTLYRLRFLTAVFVYWSLIAFYFGYSLLILHSTVASHVPTLPGIVVANLMGMLAAYTLEHWSRRDFLLSRLLEEEREKSERLLLNILPEPIADRLKHHSGTVADSFPDVTVLFADIVDFTPLSAQLSAEGTVALLNDVFSCFDALVEKHGLEKIKTIGDAYMVVGGLPEPRQDHSRAIMAMAIDMQRQISHFRRQTGEPLSLRIGINTGPVVAGVIGTKKFIYDLWGETVNLASRMETYGVAGGIQVTSAAHDQLRDHYRFTARTLLHVKGKGAMTVYLLEAAQQTLALPG